MGNIVWFIGIIAFLWFAWFATGGPYSGRTGAPFLEPPAPVGSGEIYGPGDLIPTSSTSIIRKRTSQSTNVEEESTGSAGEVGDVSLFGGKVSFTFRGRTGARESDAKKEYVEIIASKNNTQPVHITGWTLKSAVTGKSVVIGEGTYLARSGEVNPEDPIFLNPNDVALIATGRSPIGVSFKINMCSGYFEQFQDFAPPISKECPYAKSEDLPEGITDACTDFIEDIPRCETYIKALPLSLANDPQCQEYVSSKIHYSGCVELHKNDAKFYKPEWRIFFGRDQELWKEKKETILLLDNTGKIVDSVTY